MLGGWNIDVAVGSMPQKVATAMGNLALVGAEYTPIAYLGSQEVNGINHAVLAEQLVITGKDTKNVVLMIFNEKDMDVTLVNIERVVVTGGELGGVSVDVKTGDFPEDAKEAFDTAFEGYVGINVKPFALLGTQVTKGVDYIFAAEVMPVVQEPEKGVALVTVNATTKTVKIFDLLTDKQNQLGYAFTWLK